MEKEILNIQLALFFKNDYIGKFEEISLKVQEKLNDSVNTQFNPIPAAAPSDIPRLILEYTSFSLNFSKNRIDIFSKDFDAIKAPLSYLIDIISYKDIKIGRIGFIKNSISATNIDYLKTLLNQVKTTSLDFKEIAIRINLKKEIENLDCNNIQSMSNGIISKNGKEMDGIVITRDVNTIKEKISEYSFGKEEIIKLATKFNIETETLIYE